MTNLKSTKKIIEFLRTQTQAVTPTTIYKETGVNYSSVLSSLEFLTKEGLVNSVSDGHIQLITVKEKEIRWQPQAT